MFDFAAARTRMVDSQIRPSSITDSGIIGAMLDVPREHFLPAASAPMAYLDIDIAIDGGASPRRMLPPMLLARLLQAAELTLGDHVLDVGGLTGYTSALIAQNAGSVVLLEDDAAMTGRAAASLRDLGVLNATTATGPLPAGAPTQAPFDAIILNGASEAAPTSLFSQLKDGGRLVAVIGKGPGAKVYRYRAASGHVGGQPLFDAAAPLLPGFAEAPAFVF